MVDSRGRESGSGGSTPTPPLDVRLGALVEVARAVAVPVTGRAQRELRERLVRSGVAPGDVVGTYIAVGPVVGAARVVDAAVTVSLLAGYDVEADLERPSPWAPRGPTTRQCPRMWTGGTATYDDGPMIRTW